ncbi:MAG: type I-E CRISPR-associated protein Cse1/CasA [Bacteroidetes bacterium]|nr:type I-E CRISPR-associated protein Cse1/CasA [Bacteroidota bacterium]
MTPSFDLLAQPWIPLRPVGARAGTALRRLGLRDALASAHEVEAVEDASPVVVAGLNRLLLALVLSAYRGTLSDEDVWLETWTAGRFDPAVLDAYLARFADRFDLFSETHPFFGHPVEDASGTSPVARLVHDADSGNNPVFLNHALDAAPVPAPPDAVARWLVAHQQSAVGGGVSKPFNLAQGPLVGQLTFWLRGNTLFESLMLNAAPTEAVWGDGADDVPAWERPAGWAAQARPPRGLRDRLTWQSRRIRLMPDAHGRVERLAYAQGDKLDGAPPEPFAATRSTSKGSFPLRMTLQPDGGPPRPLWRDASVFLTDDDASAPRTFAWLGEHWADVQAALPPERRRAREAYLEADVLGLANDQAKVETFRHERVRLYPALLGAKDSHVSDRRAKLAEALAYAEGIPATKKQLPTGASRLRQAVRAFATRARLNKSDGTSLGDIERAERDAIAKGLGAEPRFWDALQDPFALLLHALGGPDASAFPAAVDNWKRAVRRTAFDVLRTATNEGRGGSRSLHALVEASVVLAFGRLHPPADDLPDTKMTTRPAPTKPSERATRLTTVIDRLLGMGQAGFEPNRAALAALRASGPDRFDDLVYLAAATDGTPVLPFSNPNDEWAWTEAARLTAKLAAQYATGVGLGPERTGNRLRAKLLPRFNENVQRRSLGGTLHRMRPASEEDAAALDRRVRALLDAHPDDWGPHLMRLLQLAAQHDPAPPLDVARLADDLTAALNGEADAVRRRWAFDYWLPAAAVRPSTEPSAAVPTDSDLS